MLPIGVSIPAIADSKRLRNPRRRVIRTKLELSRLHGPLVRIPAEQTTEGMRCDPRTGRLGIMSVIRCKHD